MALPHERTFWRELKTNVSHHRNGYERWAEMCKQQPATISGRFYLTFSMSFSFQLLS